MNRVKLTPNNVLVTSVCLVRKTRLTLIANKNTYFGNRNIIFGQKMTKNRFFFQKTLQTCVFKSN